jgi:hypothetical protein
MAYTSHERHNYSRSISILLLAILLIAMWLFTHHHHW